MRTGELQAPVGYDRWSYGYRDINGSKVHNSRREDRWGGEAFGPGDVIGFAIGLVDGGGDARGSGDLPGGVGGGGASDTKSSSSSTHHRNNNYHQTSSKHGKNSNHSATNHIRFFKNGEAMGHFLISRGVRTGGEAFSDIQPGTYYPAISSYMGGAARANFGPYFISPPRGLPSGMKVTPMCEAFPTQAPPPPDDVVKALRKEKIFLGGSGGGGVGRGGKGVLDERMVEAFYGAVRMEAKMRFDCYEEHMRMHLEEVREARTDRGLRTDSLPVMEDGVADVGNDIA